MRKKFEGPWKVLLKPAINKQSNFDILTLNRNGVSWLSRSDTWHSWKVLKLILWSKALLRWKMTMRSE